MHLSAWYIKNPAQIIFIAKKQTVKRLLFFQRYRSLANEGGVILSCALQDMNEQVSPEVTTFQKVSSYMYSLFLRPP